MLVRLLFVIPIYVLAASYIPNLPALQPFFESLYLVPQAQIVQIATAALVISAAATVFFVRHPLGRQFVKGESFGRLLQVGAIGALFGGLSILFDSLGGQTAQLYYLVLFPAAFMLAELAYFVLVIIQRRLTRTPEAASGGWGDGHAGPARLDALSAEPQQQVEPELVDQSPLTRVFVYIFVYALIVGLLPLQEDYQRLVEPFEKVHPNVTAGLSLAALLVGGVLGLYIYTRTSPHQTGENGQPNWLLIVLSGACGGLAFGGIINLISFALGAPGDIEILITVSIALALAELVVAMIQFRMNRQFDD